MLQAEPDPAMASEVDQLVRTIREELDAFELRSLLAGKDDFRDAQVEIQRGRRGHGGAGLGPNAHAHVHPVGRASGFHGRDARCQ